MHHRFYVNQELHVGEAFIDSLQISHQLTKVLRIRPGETVIFFNGMGGDFLSEIVFYTKEGVRALIKEELPNRRELPVRIILHHALIKKDMTELVLQKGTEIGISEFRPCITERSIRKEFHLERARKIIREATEQSGRSVLPLLFEPCSFEDSLRAFNASESGILFHPSARRAEFSDIASLIKKSERAVHIFLGPEGGFTDVEIAGAESSGIHIASLFQTTLRAETAGIVFPALLSAYALLMVSHPLSARKKK